MTTSSRSYTVKTKFLKYFINLLLQVQGLKSYSCLLEVLFCHNISCFWSLIKIQSNLIMPISLENIICTVCKKPDYVPTIGT